MVLFVENACLTLVVIARAARQSAGAVKFWLVAGTIVMAQSVGAQNVPEPATVPPTEVTLRYRNAVHFDVGGILLSNMAEQLFNKEADLLAPLLFSYERRLGHHFSVVGEVLLNGGDNQEQKKGVSLQGRYYGLPTQGKRIVTSLYVAPIVGYRVVTMHRYRLPVVHRQHMGGGALLGCQASLPRYQRVFIDFSVGLTAWKKTGTDKVEGDRDIVEFYGPESQYEVNPVMMDGRLGFGFRF